MASDIDFEVGGRCGNEELCKTNWQRELFGDAPKLGIYPQSFTKNLLATET